jgi:hypothetical protein
LKLVGLSKIYKTNKKIIKIKIIMMILIVEEEVIVNKEIMKNNLEGLKKENRKIEIK